jgi:hypothetical protein
MIVFRFSVPQFFLHLFPFHSIFHVPFVYQSCHIVPLSPVLNPPPLLPHTPSVLYACVILNTVFPQSIMGNVSSITIKALKIVFILLLQGKKESGRYEYEHSKESKSKSSSSGGAAVVPVCLPLCCAMPCVIM